MISMTSKKSLKVAVVQMQSTDNVDKNWKQILTSIEEVKQQGSADLVCFPENSLFMRIDGESPRTSFDLHENYFIQLKKISQQLSTVILLGSLPYNNKGSTYNSSILISPNGDCTPVYDKIHLFDVDVKGHKPVRESDQFVHGSEPAVVDIKGWKLGLSICYDLRFAELYTQYARKEVDVILVPAAFLVPTGKAHWHVLLRARAIENQCYIIAPAQVGPNVGLNQSIRETYGHSLVVNPWGEVVMDLGNSGQKVQVVELDAEAIVRTRTQIPMRQHRRL